MRDAPVGGRLADIDRIRSTFGVTAARFVRSLQTAVPSFPGFVVLERLGSGAFGAVFRVRDEQLGRDVALKVLLPGVMVDVEARQRFLEEARALACIRHPNVLVIHSVLEARGRIGLVTELIEGQPLNKFIQETGAFSAGEAARVGAELCRALAAVHGAGLVHRDVKPSNVLRERGGRIVLTDFGLGVFAAGRMPSQSESCVAGSPLFMAPEQARGDGVDQRTDLYALGVVLYYLTTTKFPVYSENLDTLLELIKAGSLVSLRDARPDLPEGFTQIVTRALSLKPEARFQSAGEMEQALLSCLGTAPANGDQATAPPPAASGRRAWRGLELILRFGRREFRLAIGIGLVLLACGAFFHWNVSLSSRGGLVRTPEDPRALPTTGAPIPAVPVGPIETGEVPPGSIQNADSSLLGELMEMETAHSSGQATSQETIQRAEQFMERHAEPDYQRRAKQLIVTIREARTQAGNRALAGLLTRDVNPKLKSERYDEAEADLEVLRDAYPEIAETVNVELARISRESAEARKKETERRLAGQREAYTAAAYSNVALVLDAAGSYADAQALHRKAIDMCRELFGESHPATGTRYSNLASNLEALGRHAEAQPFREKALVLCRNLLGDSHIETARTCSNLASNLDAQGKPAEAEPYHRQTLEITRRLFPGDHPAVATSINNLVSNPQLQRKLPEAMRVDKKAITLTQTLPLEAEQRARTQLQSKDVVGRATELDSQPKPAIDERRTPTEKVLPEPEKYVLSNLMRHLNPTKMEFLRDGRVKLTFDFSQKREEHENIFTPSVSKEATSVFRWSLPFEYTGRHGVHSPSTGTAGNTSFGALRISQQGTAHLNAFFTDDVEAEIHFVNTTSTTKTQTIALVYTSGTKSLGSNWGTQVALFESAKIERRKGVVEDSPMDTVTRAKLVVRNGVLEAHHNGRQVQSDKYDPETYASGRIGLIWSGGLAGFVYKLEIIGRLDMKRTADLIRKSRE